MNDLSRYAEGVGVDAALPASARSALGPTVVRVPPAARGIGKKVALVREVDRIARGFSREVRQVRATCHSGEGNFSPMEHERKHAVIA